MSWKITVGRYRLAMIESVSVKRSVEELSDTAVITLPASVYNKALDIESKIRRGDRVTVELGYDGNLMQEFDGYLESITTDDGSLKLNCEDGLFLYRVSLDDAELKGASVSSILKHVNSRISEAYPNEESLGLSCDYDFSYDKFVIRGATGYDVLKKIQEEAKPNIYLKGRTLHVHPQYAEVFGHVRYDFGTNIEKSELKYRNAADRKMMVVVESKGSDGKVIKVEEGTTGGDKTTINVSGITDTASLRRIAQEALAHKVYTGYEGSFTGWLVPYCDAGYKVTITDKDYEVKNGTYYVLGVETEFSQAGGVRKVQIGKKL